MPSDDRSPWFAGNAGSVLFFRVNRRPLRDDNLFALGGCRRTFSTISFVCSRPGIRSSLAAHQRVWRVGGVDDRLLFGIAWLARQEIVVSVSFDAKLPNPEPRDAFRDLAARMEAHNATQHSEKMRSDRDSGLRQPEQDRFRSGH